MAFKDSEEIWHGRFTNSACEIQVVKRRQREGKLIYLAVQDWNNGSLLVPEISVFSLDLF